MKENSISPPGGERKTENGEWEKIVPRSPFPILPLPQPSPVAVGSGSMQYLLPTENCDCRLKGAGGRPVTILYEDNHIVAVNKRAGEIVQGDKTGDTPLSELLKQYIKERDCKPGNVFIGVPHRLDRPVSGVALFAKTSKALERLNELFRNNEIHKTYWAVVKQRPVPDSAMLTHYLGRNEKQNKSFVTDETRPGAKEARLQYTLLSSGEHYHLLEVLLFTGRHHQIRCQLAAIGSPVKGDLKYGASRSNPDGSISLHARSIEFVHPVKKEKLTVVAPVPPDPLWQWFEQHCLTV